MLLLLLTACLTPTPPDPGPPGCAICSATSMCVAHDDADGNRVRTLCAPIPEDCGTSIVCGDNTCRDAAHSYCDAGFEPSSCTSDRITCVEGE